MDGGHGVAQHLLQYSQVDGVSDRDISGLSFTLLYRSFPPLVAPLKHVDSGHEKSQQLHSFALTHYSHAGAQFL